MLRGGILMSTGNLPESLSQRILAGVILVGRLGATQDLGAKLRALIAGVAAEDLDAEGRRLAEASGNRARVQF